ncbi:MAG: L-fucose/L-arabinose isomerase family protein [bacterium]
MTSVDEARKGSRKRKVGLLSFSDGRRRVHEGLVPVIESYADIIERTLVETGEVEVVRGGSPINSPRAAREAARRLRNECVEATIFNLPVFGFPNYATIAAALGTQPFLLLAPRDPQYPGLVGLLTVGANFEQVGIKHVRIWDDIRKPDVLARVLAFVRAGSAVNRLRGQVYGLVGGRSMGLYTTAVSTAQWQREFGVDVEHIDQFEIVRRAEGIDEGRVSAGIEWLKRHARGVEFGGGLDEGALERQVRAYCATKDIIEDFQLDFVGIKCHYEMSEYYVTQCLSTAFLNDPYDWEGRREPIVAACEADSDGALTMQLMKLVSDRPVALLDIRHYDEDRNIYVLSNCGSAPTWFSGRSDDFTRNLSGVTLRPAIPKYGAGGAHVHLVFKEGDATLARLVRRGDEYSMIVMGGEITHCSDPGMQSPPCWPHAFVRLPIPPNQFVDTLNSNHLHLVCGDYVDELTLACKFLGLEARVFEREHIPRRGRIARRR